MTEFSVQTTDNIMPVWVFVTLLMSVLLIFALILCYIKTKDSKKRFGMESTKKGFISFIKNCDIFFYAPVYFNYKGSGKYKTVLGGVLSLLLMLTILVYLPLKLLQMVGNDEIFTSTNQVYHNFDEALGQVTSSYLSFDFAVVVQNKTNGEYAYVDDRYVQVQAY